MSHAAVYLCFDFDQRRHLITASIKTNMTQKRAQSFTQFPFSYCALSKFVLLNLYI